MKMRIARQTLFLRDPNEMSPERTKKWKEILNRKRYRDYAPTLVFLGELLEIFDPGSRCHFRQHYSGLKNWYWCLETSGLRVFRTMKVEWTGSRPPLEDSNGIEITGFEGETTLIWEGSYAGIEALKVEITCIDEETRVRILSVAKELFREVREHREEVKVKKEASGLCEICEDIPEAVTVVSLSEQLPEAWDRLKMVGSHFKRCPVCGNFYFFDWDDPSLVCSVLDEMRLFRLTPDQLDLLKPVFDPTAQDWLDTYSFYLAELSYQLFHPSLYGHIGPIVSSYLYALSDTNKQLRILAQRALNRIITSKPGNAKVVTDLIREYEDDPPWWRIRIDKRSAEFQEILSRCEGILREYAD